MFLLLSAIFLWQPLVTGRVFLPTDLSYKYDYVWRGEAAQFGAQEAQNFVLSDVADYYYPYADYAISRLRAEHFPLWNPYILTGTPFFASAQAAILDPVNLLAYTGGPYSYWTWGALLRMALMGLFTYAFVRALGRGAAAGIASGIVFMACGFVTVWLNYSVVTVLAWLPALFWVTTKYQQTMRSSWLPGVALAVGLLLLGGHPETEFLVGLMWGLYVLYSMFAPRWREHGAGAAVRHGIALLGAALLGGALAAVQVGPFISFLLQSNSISERAGGPQPFSAGETAIRMAVFFFPNMTGTPLLKDYWVRGMTNFNEQTAYIGLLATALAVLGTLYWASRDRLAPFFAAGAVAAMLLAIHVPGFNLIKALPVFSVGHGVRWIIVWSFFGAVLAGYGLDALLLLCKDAKRLRDVSFLLLAGVGAAFSFLLLIYLGIRDFGWDKSWRPLLTHADMAKLFHPTTLLIYWPLLFLAAGALIALARWKNMLPPRGMAALFILLLYADLWSFGSGYNPVTPAQSIYPRTKLLSYLQEHAGHDRIIGTMNLLRPNAAMLFGLRDVRGYEDLVDKDFAALYAPFRATLNVDTKRSLFLSRDERKLLQSAGVRYVLTVRRIRGPGNASAYRWLFDENHVSLYEDRAALPRAYVVSAAVVKPNNAEATRALLAPGLDLHKTVVLTREEYRTSAIGDPFRSAVPTSQQSPQLLQVQQGLDAPPVTWHTDAPEEVDLEATCPTAGYLVLSDNYTPDWQATVDGRSAPVLRANVVYRAVALPAGRHKVSFRYRPTVVYASAAVSGVALLVLLALAAFPFVVNRRKRS